MALTGTYERTMDEKLRIAIPKRLRDELVGDRNVDLFLAPEINGALSLFGPDVFERRAAKLAQVSGAASREFLLLYYSQAERIDFDAQGRFRIPERLVTFARLQTNVVLLGIYDHVEIWDQTHWSSFLNSRGSEFDQLATQISDVGQPRLETTPPRDLTQVPR